MCLATTPLDDPRLRNDHCREWVGDTPGLGAPLRDLILKRGGNIRAHAYRGMVEHANGAAYAATCTASVVIKTAP